MTTNALRGVFVPIWLLARPEIGQGAKLVYVLLAQKVSIKGVARVLIPTLAVELGEEATQVRQFLIELENCGLIEIQKRLAESDALQCAFPAHPWAGGVEDRRRDAMPGKYTGPPKSRHSRESCIQYAQAKQRAREGIQNVYALANYFYRTGYHDQEIDAFLRKGDLSDELPPDQLSDIQ